MMILQPYRFAVSGGGQPSGSVLLIGAEGSDGSTTIVDESPVGRTLTANGACAIETTGALVGSSSLGINLANESTGYLSMSASSDFNFGTGDFTIEGRAKQDFSLGATYVRAIFGNLTYNPDNGFGLAVLPGSHLLEFSWNTGSSLTQSSGTGVGTTAFHFAISRNGSNLRMFKDGVQVGINSSFGSVNVGNGSVAPNVGQLGYASTDERWRGKIDELRVIKGTGLYTGNFTPSTPYPR